MLLVFLQEISNSSNEAKWSVPLAQLTFLLSIFESNKKKKRKKKEKVLTHHLKFMNYALGILIHRSLVDQQVLVL